MNDRLATDIELYGLIRNGAVRFYKTLKKPTKTGNKLLVDFVNFVGKEKGVDFEFTERQLTGNQPAKKTNS